jgi:hypothetical protein
MVDDGWYTAVLDRTEAELAVLVLEDGADAVGDLMVPLDELPCEARVSDSVLRVRVEAGEFVDARFDADRTASRRDRARRRFARLSRRLPAPDDEESDTGNGESDADRRESDTGDHEDGGNDGTQTEDDR